MQGYNVIAVFNQTADKLLMCRRSKNPYQGLLNLVGGKIEPGEDGFSAAYRELEEETSITRDDITLSHLMDFTYYFSQCLVEVYVGKLNKPITVAGEENDLFWIDSESNFFDVTKYAGRGNIGHIVQEINCL
jgi:8-oxo-dGTP diphosphatase